MWAICVWQPGLLDKSDKGPCARLSLLLDARLQIPFWDFFYVRVKVASGSESRWYVVGLDGLVIPL